MKFLHTSDWHLGKKLEGISRLDEQKMFMEELYTIVEENSVEVIIIAGDIYDNSNPPAAAEELFYEAMHKLSNNEKRMIIIIAGNHDNPERLKSISPLAFSMGIIIVGYPNTIIPPCNYNNFSIINSSEGVFELHFNGEKIVFANMAYPNEKRLFLSFEDNNQIDLQKNFSLHIQEIFQKRAEYFREDTINIVTGHFFVNGSIKSDSEREIQIGGSYGVDSNAFPVNADYIAMGHMHKNQRIRSNIVGFYSGSPIQYSLSERTTPKYVNIIDIKNHNVNIDKIELTNYKPIELWKVTSADEALAMAYENKDKDSYVYLQIVSNDLLTDSKRKEIKEVKSDIISIILSLNEELSVDDIEELTLEELSIIDEFTNFYISHYKTEPSEEIVNMFAKIFEEE